MSMNEAETHVWWVSIPLKTVLTPPPVEPTGPRGRRRKGPGRTDYPLCVQVGDALRPLPSAVPEANQEAADPLKGMQQARGYADTRRFEVKYVFATNSREGLAR